MVDFVYEGFDELKKAGYVSEMHSIEHFDDGRLPVIRPAFNLETCQTCGHGSGTKVRLNGRGGYDSERERANTSIGEKILTVKLCHVDSWSSTYEFEEMPGRWNTVMFEKIDD